MTNTPYHGYNNSDETPVPSKIMTYNEWKAQAGSNDKYGHYAEYVVCSLLRNVGVDARQATDQEDAPGGGDVVLLMRDGNKFFIDCKTMPNDKNSMSFNMTGKNTADFIISYNDVERLRSDNADTTVRFLNAINSISDAYKQNKK